MALKQIGIPAQLQGVSPEVLVTQVNWDLNNYGSGNVGFWEIYGGAVLRDSTAKSVNGGVLQNQNSGYAVLTMGALEFIAKGDTEGRSRADGKVGALMSYANALRIDNRATPIPVREGFDPTGAIWQRLNEAQTIWAAHLPQQVLLKALVLGQDMFGNALPVGHDGKALFATDHPVNLADKTITATYSNSHTLSSKIEEGQWADVLDKIERVPDFNNTTLPNVGSIPMVVVASHKQAIRWRRFVGGKEANNVSNPIVPVLVNGQPIGIYSCMVDSAMIVVDQYLYQIATDKAAAELTSYVFTRKGRPALIYREEQTPMVQISGLDKRYENKSIELVSDAYVGAGYGDPRSVHKIVEKAS